MSIHRVKAFDIGLNKNNTEFHHLKYKKITTTGLLIDASNNLKYRAKKKLIPSIATTNFLNTNII